jgi:hypothetical protein
VGFAEGEEGWLAITRSPNWSIRELGGRLAEAVLALDSAISCQALIIMRCLRFSGVVDQSICRLVFSTTQVIRLMLEHSLARSSRGSAPAAHTKASASIARRSS